MRPFPFLGVGVLMITAILWPITVQGTPFIKEHFNAATTGWNSNGLAQQNLGTGTPVGHDRARGL